jgi:hypothetical protein
MIDGLEDAPRQATDSARESVQQTRLAHDLADAYSDLGHRTFALLEQGALAHPRLASSAEQIGGLERKLAELTRQTAEPERRHDAGLATAMELA